MTKYSKKKKHYVITNKFRFITFLTVCMLICAFGASALLGLSSAEGSDIREYVEVEVESGDTLWQLAKEYGPQNTDVRRVVYEISKINNVSAETLQSGMILTIPTTKL